jgi:hypothetical protein
MHPKVEEAFEEIDAALYSGDAFYNDEERIRLRELLGRWQRKVDEIEEFKVNESNPDGFDGEDHFDSFDEADREPPPDTDDADAPTEEIDGFTAAGEGNFLDECNYGERK